MQDPLVFEAMQYALQARAKQKRKYTGIPYFTHLAEVAGITASVVDVPEVIAGAWLHDTIEDCDVTYIEVQDRFGSKVAEIVLALSDLETEGNRATRKAAARNRLSSCGPWVQTIKVADIISNTSSIVLHDPKFARVYMPECIALLDALVLADPRLVAIARNQIAESGFA